MQSDQSTLDTNIICELKDSNMNLIGATYIRVSKLSSCFIGGLPDLTEFDFRPHLTSESTACIEI